MKKLIPIWLISCLFLCFSNMAIAKKTDQNNESYGNNLSNPVIFAEGIGITGLPTTETTGLRGPEESLVEPFTYNDIIYYLQQTENSWQAEWVDGDSAPLNFETVRVDWSDNIVRQTWTEQSVIRCEVVLFKDLEEPMQGYDMTYLYGEGIDEVWGTTGSIVESFHPTVYSINARWKIEKLDDKDGNPVGVLYNSAIYERFGVDGQTDAYAAEVNVPGKIIYGFNWDLAKFDMSSIGLPNEPKSGWYRLTFSLDPTAIYNITDDNGNSQAFNVPCNTALGSLDAGDLFGSTPEVVVYQPALPSAQETYLDIYIEPKTKGGGKK